MKSWIGIAVSVVLVFVLAGTAAMAADTSPPATTTVSTDTIDLDLTDARIDSALKTLFSGQGYSFVLEQNVSGMVKDVHVKSVTFETALKALLRSVDPPLTYRKERDVYYISVRKEPAPETPPTTPTTPVPVGGIGQDDTGALKSEDMILEKIMLNFMDASDIKAMIMGQDIRGTGTAGSSGGYGGYGGYGGGNGGFGGGRGGFGGMSGGYGGGNGGFGGGGFGGGGFGGMSGGYGGYGGGSSSYGGGYGGGYGGFRSF